MARTALSLLLAAISTSATMKARAHISLDAPKSRYYNASTLSADQIKQKEAPCGAKGDSRSTDPALISTFTPGQRITVSWKETIQHPGHFRIAFDTDGQDFLFPGVLPLPAGVTVLADDILDQPNNGQNYTQEVTLPDVECSKCTLQLVQVMVAGKGPYKAADLYFNCADLVLKADASSGGSGGATSGGAAAGGGGGGGTSGGSSGVAGAGAGGAPGSGGAGVGGALAGSGMGGTPSSGGAATASGGSAATSGGIATNGGTAAGGNAAAAAGVGSGGAPTTTGGTTDSTPGGRSAQAGGGSPPASTPMPVDAGCTLPRRASPVGFGALALAAWTGAIALRRRRRR